MKCFLQKKVTGHTLIDLELGFEQPNFGNACLVTSGPKFTSKSREFILDEYKKISMGFVAY